MSDQDADLVVFDPADYRSYLPGEYACREATGWVSVTTYPVPPFEPAEDDGSLDNFDLYVRET